MYITVTITQHKTILVVTCNVAHFHKLFSVNQLLPPFTQMLSLTSCMDSQMNKDK